MKKKIIDRNQLIREKLQQIKDERKINAKTKIGMIKSCIDTIEELKGAKHEHQLELTKTDDFNKQQQLKGNIFNLEQNIKSQENRLLSLKEELFWLLKGQTPKEFKKDLDEYYTNIETWFEKDVKGVLI